ncbi:MBL fold metallo-hydrolase [Haloimpatiens sp. FM7330]|uniref:MBL fold metallo-hydrolase n=1 Tax=Haloimpatiens sp. FM7330 TaxID=3298610 RepID=UPI0036279C9E
MQLNKLKGNSYYINAPTNIGVYTFKNKNCILIDTGINNSQAKKIDEVLTQNNLHPKYIINTHSHTDHCGGNLYFQDTYPGCTVYASKDEKTLMENTNIQASILFSGNPLKPLKPHKDCFKVDLTLENGINKINNDKFEIISLKGHSIDQIGIITPEKVCFLGDSIFSNEILDKYSFPFLNNIEESINTLEYIKEIDADYFVISHSEKILNKEDIISLIDRNLTNINNYTEQFLELLDQPLSIEDLLENIAILNDLDLNFKQYHLNFSAVCAFLTYLYDKKFIKYSIENGRLYYFKSN